MEKVCDAKVGAIGPLSYNMMTMKIVTRVDFNQQYKW